MVAQNLLEKKFTEIRNIISITSMPYIGSQVCQSCVIIFTSSMLSIGYVAKDIAIIPFLVL